MQFPKLTPLQTRFLASFVASAILVGLYLSLTSPHFAYAVDLDSRIPRDHNHPIILDNGLTFDDLNDVFEHENAPDMRLDSLFERETAADAPSGLANNAAQSLNIEAGQTQSWVFPKAAIDGANGDRGRGLPGEDSSEEQVQTRDELRKRQDQKTVYITLNTCLQPSANSSSANQIPPQLEMYISQSSTNTNPGPTVNDPNQKSVMVSGGYAIATLEADDDVYIGVSALNSSDFSGFYNYQIAASIDAPFHSYNSSSPGLHFVDSDNHAALLITDDATETNSSSPVFQEWMTMAPPYGMFAHNMNDSSILGVKNSYCGLLHNAQIIANIPNMDNQNIAGMTDRGLRGKPKEQFYVQNLNATSQYWGFLAMAGNSTSSSPGTVGGGGKIWASMSFNTKTESNCALLYNLTFCSEVAYAVPSNPDKFSPITGLNELAAVYDNYSATQYKYFNYSLQQIPCNTTSSAQYSLARTCTDCANAYKQWLCAVTIPRCEDFSATEPWLKERNTAQKFTNGSSISILGNASYEQTLLGSVATNSSRNPIIDTDIQPGPYKEVLPCQDLCWDLVQSCPAALQFGCPYEGRGLEDSYGARSSDPGNITCSYLGAAYYLSGAERRNTGAFGVGGVLGVAAVMVAAVLL